MDTAAVEVATGVFSVTWVAESTLKISAYGAWPVPVTTFPASKPVVVPMLVMIFDPAVIVPVVLIPAVVCRT